VQHRDFALGAADGVVDQVQFDLELLALLDLGAIGFQQRPGFGDLACYRCPVVSPAAARWAVALAAICARMERLAMISRCIGPISPPSTRSARALADRR
jgi:hypothetical protein